LRAPVSARTVPSADPHALHSLATVPHPIRRDGAVSPLAFSRPSTSSQNRARSPSSARSDFSPFRRALASGRHHARMLRWPGISFLFLVPSCRSRVKNLVDFMGWGCGDGVRVGITNIPCSQAPSTGGYPTYLIYIYLHTWSTYVETDTTASLLATSRDSADPHQTLRRNASNSTPCLPEPIQRPNSACHPRLGVFRFAGIPAGW
jgi:hypothetical protein